MNTEEQYAIIAIAGSLRRDNTIFTEEAIKKAAKTHKNLSTVETEQGLALVWKGRIPNEPQIDPKLS